LAKPLRAEQKDEYASDYSLGSFLHMTPKLSGAPPVRE
jgi:hypothetical protein